MSGYTAKDHGEGITPIETSPLLGGGGSAGSRPSDYSDVPCPYPTRRISLGLRGGGEMHVSLPGKPDEPVDERTLEALRSIGEAALARVKGERDAGE